MRTASNGQASGRLLEPAMSAGEAHASPALQPERTLGVENTAHGGSTLREHEQDPVPIDADAMTGMVGDPARSVEFFGTSSAGSFLRQINSAIDAQLGQTPATTPWDLDGVSPVRATSGHGSRGMKLKDPQDYSLPQRTFADDLLRAYHDEVWAVIPVHDWVVFWGTYKRVWLGSASPIPEQTLYCLLNLAFALGSQFSQAIDPGQRRVVGQSFWNRARKLFAPHTHDGASIERVQCMLLMGLYLQSTCETYECWMTIGSAIRMAQSLGLHLAQSTTRVLAFREIEISRRVWHGCVYMDRVLSMTFGRPSMIARWVPPTLQVPLPSMIDDEFLDTQHTPAAMRPDGQPAITAFFVKTLELYDIVNDVLLELYQGAADVTSKETRHLVAVLQFDDRLLQWLRSLPEHLKYSSNSRDEGIVYERQRIVLQARYLQARIAVLRPVLADYYLKPVSSRLRPQLRECSLSQHLINQSAALCFEAAHEMIDVLYARFDFETVTGPVPAWWFAVLFIYTAATVLLAERLRPIDNGTHHSARGSENVSWDKAIELLKAYARVGQSAERCNAALGILSAKIQAATQTAGTRGASYEVAVHEGSASAVATAGAELGQPRLDEDLAFPVDFGDMDFNIDDMLWLNTSAAEIIF
ncbi:uncharacterized protein Z520_02656 [Fonsecaea multimorphosa CBS 102226]|uniref:Xylanolytic transcriptional activator regulatory domain-containing protein n=1 Tax=Fonsecaea multimorphosa CBS 102226 TaxID=1442371 RepID=A0A0D2KWD6_9EURO|nr:uncharacterized protein Z520_02656 [Fonsecaea multimorphosa CBS 102226]KIY01104.1 hypothetical protein Z520_02656 [Fonsecaea multimorphosa CBS 102226]OAL28725.1 hypothetical protein AYO22_02590 [Fonsecaea multimorphosa]